MMSAYGRAILLTVIFHSLLLPSPTMGDTPGETPGQEILTKGQLVNAVFSCIGKYYIDFNQLKVHEVLNDAMKGVERAVPNLMVSVNTHDVKVQIDGANRTFEIGGIAYWADLRDLLKEILLFIESSGRCSVPFSELEYAALNNVLSGFDPYSKLYQPRDFQRAENLGASSFVGLGMDIEFREGSLAVIEIYENSSAQRAGLQIGDRIIEIDGEPAQKMSLREALQRMSGLEGTNVAVSVVRDGKIKSYVLERQRVEVKNVIPVLLKGDIGYIKISNFQDGTFKSVMQALEGLKKEANLRGLIIDFRGNYGGVLDEIIRVGDLFLSSGILNIKLSVEKGYPDFVRAKPSGNREEHYPLVVLIDEGSASGAEILAAAFKENGRAIILGEQSFGKACIQQVFALKGKYAVKLTTARYYTPNGRYIQYVGLAPDVLLIPIKVDRDNPTLTRRVHYLNEGLIRNRIERPPGEEKPLASLVYLEGERSANRSGPESDDQVRLAKRLIEENVLIGGTVWWDECKRVLRQVQKEEEEKTVKALKGQGIDWSSGMPEGIPVPTARINLDKEINEVDAGRAIDITVNVENRGDGTLYRVLGRSSSTNPAFDGLEFPIGVIEPGRSRSYTLKVDVPEDSLDRRDEMVIKFTEDNGFEPPYLAAWITTWAQPTPAFAYSYRISDDAGGKYDGLIHAGEHIAVTLSLRNVGEGHSKDTVVMLRVLSPEGISTDNPRARLGLLKTKEEKTVKFGFNVGDTPAESLVLEVIAADINLGINLVSTISLPIEKRHIEAQPYSGILKVTTGGAKVYGGRSETSPALAPLVEDSFIRADGRMNAWFRIPLTGGLTGWVRVQDTSEVSGTTRNVQPEEITPVSPFPFRPPTVTLREGVLTARKGSVDMKFHVEDDQDVRVAYVMVNDVKVFYEYNKNSTDECDFTAELPIAEGLNLVRVIAYDNQGLSTEKPFVITGI